MKLKYYLRGLGVGIILTVILMMIGFSSEKNSISDEEIIERARRMGMVMKEEQVSGLKDAKNQSADQADGEIQGTEPGAESGEGTEGDNQQDPNAADGQTPESGNSDGQAAEPDASPEAEPNKTQGAETEYVAFEVARGEYSDTISQKLFEAGLINDAEVFNKYLVQGGIDSKILVGMHNIPKGSTPEEIARILCEKPVE